MTAVNRQRAPQPESPTFVELYEDHFAFVWRSVRRLGVDDASLDDAVQDVFLVVHRRLGDFEGRSTVKSWLFGIARRVAKDHRRRRDRKDAGKVPAELEQMSAPEIAEATETNLNTVYSRLRVARQRFAKAVQATSGGGHD